MKNFVVLSCLVIMSAATIRAADADIVLTNEASFTGVATGGIGNTGSSNFTSQGQSFTVPVGATVLDRFSLWMVHRDLSSAIIEKDLFFRAFVMAWDGPNLRADGPILYQSDIHIFAATNPVSFPALSDFTRFDFNTGGVAVSEGTQMVAFVSIIDAGNIANNRVAIGWTTDTFPDVSSNSDRFVISQQTDLLGLTNSNSWTVPLGFPATWDLAFEARFNSIPEPTSFGALAVFALVVTTTRRSRKRIALV